MGWTGRDAGNLVLSGWWLRVCVQSTSIDAVREVTLTASSASAEATLHACLAAILELPLDSVPEPVAGAHVPDWRLARWLGGIGVGLVPIASVASFSWAGPWIGWIRPSSGDPARAVVMYGVPSGVAWDPTDVARQEEWQLQGGLVVAALDIGLALPPAPDAPISAGTVEALLIAPQAGAPAQRLDQVRMLADRGLDGDRHTMGTGTFPSGLPGSALTLIEAEVCESFTPPLDASEHRRNVVTRGINLNGLIGREFVLGDVRCRGVRLCEPCIVVERYATRPVLRQLIHRGGLRADILDNGTVRNGDPVQSV